MQKLVIFGRKIVCKYTSNVVVISSPKPNRFFSLSHYLTTNDKRKIILNDVSMPSCIIFTVHTIKSSLSFRWTFIWTVILIVWSWKWCKIASKRRSKSYLFITIICDQMISKEITSHYSFGNLWTQLQKSCYDMRKLFQLFFNHAYLQILVLDLSIIEIICQTQSYFIHKADSL